MRLTRRYRISLPLLALAALATLAVAAPQSRHTQVADQLARHLQPDQPAPATAPAATGDRIEIVLQNGATVRARLLHRDRNRAIVDLGYEVMTIPTSEIVKARATENAQSSEPSPTPDGGSATATSRQPRPVTGAFDENLEHIQEAVVMVSNARGMGAGFLIRPDGLLMTNFHVVRGERLNEVTVFLRNARGEVQKTKYRDAEVKAYSSLLDVAIVQIPPEQLSEKRLPFVELAPGDSIRTGMRVHAIGNPAVGAKVLDHTVSDGIVSSASRNFNDVIYVQTTAAVNPGNSGGPLLNDRGQVVGMVTFRAFFQEGLAFALPSWYLSHFRAQQSAYSPTGDDKKLGYRYHSPSDPKAAQ